MSEVIDMSDLLDASIDDLADLPEFTTYPAGTHRVTFTWKAKKVNDTRAFEFKFSAIETLELADPATDQPLEAGAETTTMYQLDNEFAQGKFKPLVKALAEHHGVATIGEALELSQNMELVIVTKVRVDRKDKDKKYTDVVSFVV